MISDPIKNLTASSTTTSDVVGAFNTIFNDWFTFAILFALFLIIAVSLYAWNRDLIGSFMNAGYTISFVAFLLTIAKTSSGTPLLSFAKAMWFIVITGLLIGTKKVVE